MGQFCDPVVAAGSCAMDRVPAESRRLLVDISNSFTKFTVSLGGVFGEVHRIPTSGLDGRRILEAAGGGEFERVVFCSVVPRCNPVLHGLVPPVRVLEVGHRCSLGIGIDYPDPASIGADRLANAAGAVHLFGAPVVVLDFGTAVTFDIVDSGGSYVGGVIAPGLEAMTSYLHERTALLPRIELENPPSVIGKSTRHAMLAGSVYGYKGLIERILREVKGELNLHGMLPVVATGGYADLIAGELPGLVSIEPTLTLRGLDVAAWLNPPGSGP